MIICRRNRKPKVQQLNISKPTLYKSLPQFTETVQITSEQSETVEVTEITDSVTFDEPCFDITGEIHYDNIYDIVFTCSIPSGR